MVASKAELIQEEKDRNTQIYKDTTTTSTKVPFKKPKRRDKSDLGPDFIAPDGGWGWVVCFAAGCSNLSLFPALQQYGLIYKDRLAFLGFDAKQTTTIVNVIMAISALAGILNGAMFRRFTFRQVGIVGAALCFTGILLSAFCVTFFQYIAFFSCIYGIGLGLNMAATSLAVNTYFKNRRRRASGFSWTITGLGPIIFPHFSTFLLVAYGVQGTILIYAGIALNALLCAVTLQPVLWHVKSTRQLPSQNDTTKGNGEAYINDALPDYECTYCQMQKKRKRSIFSSQYLFNDDDPNAPGYEIIGPVTPMLARANDGWYGSKLSLASTSCNMPRSNSKLFRKNSQKEIHQQQQQCLNEEEDKPDMENLLNKPNYFNRERTDLERYTSKVSLYSKLATDELHCTCAEDKMLMQQQQQQFNETPNTASGSYHATTQNKRDGKERALKEKLSFCQKVVHFFDLGLLKDITFVNLSFGMTVMMFGEMNFSVLTPFILSSLGYKDQQISLAMSLLGGVDIMVRFSAPFILEKVKLGNQVLFAFGILAISIGRFIVTMADSYAVIIAVFVLIGFGKGFRTIFNTLIIPSYVPLSRLPAASGLQLIFNAIFSFAFGPVLGLVTDIYGYKVTIHFINCMTCIALMLWLSESMVRRMLRKKVTAEDS